MLFACSNDAFGLEKRSSADVTAMLSTTAVHAGDHATVAVVVNVHDGLHAQSHTPVDSYAIKFVVTTDDNANTKFGEVVYPPGQDVTFPSLGKLNVYEGKTVIRIPITIGADASAGPLKISGTVRFQACTTAVCFPPEKVKFAVDIAVVPMTQAVEANSAFPEQPTAPAPATAPAATIAPPITGSSTVLGFDLDRSPWPLAFAAAFLIGIVFNLMPCVLPVLPLKIMGFYEVSKHDRAKSILLGGVFSAGLIASFAVLAALIVGSAKLQWGGLFQHTWFTITISVVLVAMAISTFGFFTVNVPTALYSFTPRHDTYVGNFLFGILTAALSTPCTFGMLVGLLAWALKQPAWMGGSSIVMVGVGMAFPYFVLSAVPEVARNFPRTGPWAEVVKQMMGFLLLATAVFFARPLFQHVSDSLFWWSLFAVIAAGGVFLIVRAFQLSDGLRPRVIACALAVLIVTPTFFAVHRITEKPFEWTPYSDQALASATAAGKPVLIDFTADWCTNCHYIEAFVLHNSKVVHAVHDHGVVMLQADVTYENALAHPLLNKLTPDGAPPLTAVYLPHIAEPKLLHGIYSTDDLIRSLQ